MDRGRCPKTDLAVAMLTAAGLLLPGALSAAVPPTQTMTAPTFGAVTLYPPDGEVQQVVLFISGDGGWNLGVIPMAERLRQEHALVVGIDIRILMKNLEASTQCAYPAGALEELSRAVQLRFKLPAYKRPILVGYSSGATLVYAAIAAAPPETFVGAISLGFCSDVEIRVPPCQMRGLKATKRAKGMGYDLAPYPGSTVPWMVLQGQVDQVCDPSATTAFVTATGAARIFSLPKVGHGFGVTPRWEPQFVEAYHAIAVANARPPAAGGPPPAPALAHLSLVEVPPVGQASGDTMAIILTGDGGWADIDRRVSAGLADRGVPVVGWSSLDYYWTPRTPDGAASDLARIIDHYASAWKRSRVIIVGYSFGADVAPFLVNRLSGTARASVSHVALLSPSDQAAFEFHMTSWLGGGSNPHYLTLPEINRLSMPVICVAGADEADSACRHAHNPLMKFETVGRGHHFGGNYERIVDLVLNSRD
jgi:type IV secretory pathway VirJ component